MYETVIWVAFIAVLTALIFELRTRGRYFLMGAMPVAVLSLILADTQPTILDGAIHPLVPVLRHNFWLVVHVLTIVSSYAPLALALGVSHIALGKTILGRPVDNALYQYIYRCLQIGIFLLGTGTILGGVWANYSWGRFWGWDPKETWALIAFLSYLAILHGRIAGWWGGFGMAVGSFFAFQTVIMAWYGVNFVLGKGLHSYGFGTGGFPAVATFVVLELAFAGLALWCRYKGPLLRSPAAA
jgi:ABC-type transport system involved in cytochrome c biogenesis permease subunit